jgi:hypothetical protein
MSEWRSCFTCLGKVCGCRKKTSKGVKAGSISFTVTNDINVEVTTQGEDHDGNDLTGPPRHPPYVPTEISLKLVKED